MKGRVGHRYQSIEKIAAFAVDPRVWAFLLVVFHWGIVSAQDPGEIQKVEYEIIKAREITLPQASRNFEKVPPRVAEPIKPEIVYQFKTVAFNTPDYNPSVRPMKLKAEPISKIYGNYLSAGFGNFMSPYFEGYATNKRNKNKALGVKLFHRSFGSGPVGEGNSASGNTEIKAFAKAMTNRLSAGGFLSFESRDARFYGTVPNTLVADARHQAYTVLSMGADLANAKKSDFNFELAAGFSHLRDRFTTSENELKLHLASSYRINDSKAISVDADYFLMNRKTETLAGTARHIMKIKPSYRFSPSEKLSLAVGFNAAIQNDTLGNGQSFRFYPNVDATYELAAGAQVFGAFTGDIDRVSVHTLSLENIWLNQNVGLTNANRTIEVTGGLKGKISGKIAYRTGFAMANIRNMHFFQNNFNDPSKFEVVYDRGNVKRTNIFAELGYGYAETVKLVFRGDYFAYSTDEVAEAFHRPTYRLSFNSTFNVYNKLVLDIDMLGQGGMKALAVDAGLPLVTVPAALDVNAKATYLVSKQFSVFASSNNILNSNYQMYLYYPVRGFQAMVGASLSF